MANLTTQQRNPRLSVNPGLGGQNMDAETGLSKSQRVLQELRNYLLISAYLYVCFGVLAMNEAALLQVNDVQFAPYGVALIKALVLGKVILIGHVLSVGQLSGGAPLLHKIAWKALAMLLFLLAFKALEELVVGWHHGETTARIMAELLDRSWIEFVAPITLMLLPLIASIEFFRAIGGEGIRKVLLGRNEG